MEGLGAAILLLTIILIIIVGALITVYVLFLVNLRNLLREISDVNRQMPPANVFLMLVPFFSLVYSFIMFTKISDSLKLEYEMRGRVLPGDGLRTLGLAMSVLMVLYVVFNYSFSQIAGLFSLAYLVIMIIYWVKSAQIKKELQSSANIGRRPDLLD